MPETTRQNGFPNFAAATRAARPKQKMRSGILRAAHSECARPPAVPLSGSWSRSLSAERARSFRVAPSRALLHGIGLNHVFLNQHLPQATDFLRTDALVLEEVQNQ